MLVNRSMPCCTVIPELAYADVMEAADWLCNAFGFTVRLRIAHHRVQLNAGNGAVVVTERRTAGGLDFCHSTMVRVENVDAHQEHAMRSGARLLSSATDYPYGERQYSVEDPGGHRWTFSQSIRDVAPEEWGGGSGEL